MQALHGSASIKMLKTLKNARLFYSSSFLKRMVLFWKSAWEGAFPSHDTKAARVYHFQKYYYLLLLPSLLHGYMGLMLEMGRHSG